MGQVLAWEVIRANTFTFDFFLQKLSDVDSRLQQIPSFLLAAKAKVSKTLHFDSDFTFPGGLSSSSLHTITGRTANSIALYNITIHSVLHHIFVETASLVTGEGGESADFRATSFPFALLVLVHLLLLVLVLVLALPLLP